MLCDTKFDPCLNNPCYNGGTCMISDSIDGFNCSCVTGFQGNRCKDDVNECLENPCMNGGTCFNEYGSYKCFCPAGNNTISLNESNQ